MCKALGSVHRKVPSCVLPVEALKERVGEADPNGTGHLLPARHRGGPLHARAEGTKGSQPFTVLENTQSFPSASRKLLGNVKAPVLQELGSKETRVWAMGGKQPHDALPQQPWAGTV